MTRMTAPSPSRRLLCPGQAACGAAGRSPGAGSWTTRQLRSSCRATATLLGSNSSSSRSHLRHLCDSGCVPRHRWRQLTINCSHTVPACVF